MTTELTQYRKGDSERPDLRIKTRRADLYPALREKVIQQFRPFAPDPTMYEQASRQDVLCEHDGTPAHREDIVIADYPSNAIDGDEQPSPASMVSVERTFKEAFNRQRLTLEDLLPYRLRAAFRICRHVARTMGHLAPDDQLLDVADPSGNDIFTTPAPIKPSRHQQPTGAVLRQKIIECRDEKTTLLPPRIPKELAEDIDGYDPRNDTGLLDYLKVVERAAVELNIAAGSPTEPLSGQYGLAGLLDPLTARVAWPSRMQIVAFEQVLIEETLNIIIRHGALKAPTILHERYGLRTYESAEMLKMARNLSNSLTSVDDVETARSFMLLRLDDFCRRAREGLDLRAELSGLKAISVIQGLARTEGGDIVSDFVNVVRSFTKEQGGMQLAPVPDGLMLPPPGKFIDVEVS